LVGPSTEGGGVQQRGFLLIADITGYTVYLSESELDHAEGTLTDLLELLVDHTRPPLRISGLAGDAVLSYGLEGGFVSPQTFIEGIEDTYVAFRRAIELMVLNNTCECNACANVSSLDLKFFIHYGSFALQTIGEFQELVGSDVNLIHRLLKNRVSTDLGIRAYILCTDAAENALGLGEDTDGLVRHVESSEDFGEVVVWVRDMLPVFESRRDETLVTYGDDEVLVRHESTIAVPPEIVWDYLNQSRFRDLLMGSDRSELLDRVDGRVAEGSVYQCYHGDMAIPQVVVEWRPPERVVVRMTAPVPLGPVDVLVDFGLERVGEGTRLTETLARLTGPMLGRIAFRVMAMFMRSGDRRRLASFGKSIEADYASHSGETAALPPVTREQIGTAAGESLRSAAGS
jgi:uncharacterized protein YndB with AHSA1/START domain